jgi:Cft2 family RNA processing exonuclease
MPRDGLQISDAEPQRPYPALRTLPELLSVSCQPDAPWVEVLSGTGRKGPACIRLWTGRKLWLLDIGSGPDAHAPFQPAWLYGADAVFITHDHEDHIGGAAHAVRAGLPIYATVATARALPAGADLRLLPERGAMVCDGVKITTGRNGHALGGVWLHFALGREGLFYSGDWSEESQWFAFDPPPAAGTALIDASYHLDRVRQAERKASLDQALDALSPECQILFPVPASGRAGELALHLMSRGEVSIDQTCQIVLTAALHSQGVTAAAQQLLPLLNRAFNPKARYLICETPNADGGMAWQIVQNWQETGEIGRRRMVFFTGHMTDHATAIAARSGRFFRWNVHPPIGDQLKMLTRLRARRFAPLFCTSPECYSRETAVTFDLISGDRTLL